MSSRLPDLRVVRGEQRFVEAPARVRLEILTPTASVEAVGAVLESRGLGAADAFVHPVTLAGAH